MTNELKPCPFCGGEAYAVDVLEKRAHAVCDTCHASTAYYFSEVEAIAAWNTRAERTCQQVDVTVKYQPYVTHMTACSLCGETLAVEEYPAPNYCSKCGARVVD